MVLFFLIEHENIITYRSNNYIYYVHFDKEINIGQIPFNLNNNYRILSYDIDIISKTIFFSTSEGVFQFCWGDEITYLNQVIKISDRFNEPKIKFDNIGKMLYILEEGGIFISVYPYMDFTRIIEERGIINLKLLPEVG